MTLHIKLTAPFSLPLFIFHSTATTPGYTDSKYIVSARCLLELFEKCPICKRPSEVTPCRRGTFLAVYQKCPHCGFYREWKSQPVIGSCPIINLQLSAAIYFTGTSFFQLQKVLNHTLESTRHSPSYFSKFVLKYCCYQYIVSALVVQR